MAGRIGYPRRARSQGPNNPVRRSRGNYRMLETPPDEPIVQIRGMQKMRLQH
jgi:hypothetical protein